MTFVTIAHDRQLARPAALSYERMQACGMPTGGINSAYRPHEEQRRLFLARYREQATGLGLYGDVRWYQGKRYVRHSALGSVAVPGGPTSRHESGLAIDIATGSAAHAWMVKHGHNHGWVADVPGEPWHFEYRAHLDTQPSPPVQAARPTPTIQEEVEMFITRKGRSVYVLVTGSKATNISKQAAETLRDEANVPIVSLPIDDVTEIQRAMNVADIS